MLWQSVFSIHVGRKWTRTHGFFALMGGFMLFDRRRPVKTILPEELESDEFEFPEITESRIQDKSKGDVLSKGIVVFQTGWFLIQIIARGVEGLPVTELELVTLAFAVLNFVTYGLWWNKPLDVRCAVPVYKKRVEAVTEGEAGEGARKNEDQGDADGGPVFQRTARAAKRLPAAFGAGVRDAIKTVRRMVWLDIVAIPFKPFFEMAGGIKNEYIADEKRANTFYSGDLTTNEGSIVLFAGFLVATMFGAVHCIGWSFAFPSHTERILWRVSSIIIVSAPTCYFLVLSFLGAAGLPDVLGIIFIITLCFAYGIGRVTLLVLPFLSLRSLPPGAYQTVHWTTFIPHI